MKLEPQDIWKEYNKIKQYCSNQGLYEDVKRQEDFYIGKQWGELTDGKIMPHPVINILQPAVKHHIATLSTNDVAISLTPFSVNPADSDALRPVEQEIERVIESARVKEKAREMIRNGAVDGSAYLLFTFDADYETHQAMKGRIECELVDNTNVFFGNPYSNVIQKQPYIIIALRQHIDQVKSEAKSLGLSKQVIESIKGDNDGTQANDDSNNLVTVLFKFYRKKKKLKEKKIIEENGLLVELEVEKEVETIWFTKTTQDVVLIEPTDLEYKMYPIARFGWESVKNSYLFNSPLKSVIPNQVFLNKMVAMTMLYAQNNALPKTLFDDNKIALDDLLDGMPLAVSGLELTGKFFDFIKSPDFSPQILGLIDAIETKTKNALGINDAVLGNVKPENTSAIIALQESANVPLELQRQAYYEMWEDAVRIILDIMSVRYKKRSLLVETDGQPDIAEVDFSMLQNQYFDLKVDIGNSAQYSEIAQVNTLDKLFQNQIIDAKTYVDLIPSKYVPSKNKIAKNVEEMMMKAQQEAMASQQI